MRLEDVVVAQHDVGAIGAGGGPPLLRTAVDDRDAAARKPALALALPDELHARRAHNRGRERLVHVQRGKRLDGLAQPLLVGEERAPLRQDVAHRGTLKRPQLASEPVDAQLGVMRERERDRRFGASPLGLERLHPPDRRVGRHDVRVRVEQLAQVRREHGVRGNREHVLLEAVGALVLAREGDDGLRQPGERLRGIRQPVALQLEALRAHLVTPERERRAGGTPPLPQRTDRRRRGGIELDRGVRIEQRRGRRVRAQQHRAATTVVLGGVQQLRRRLAIEGDHDQPRGPLVRQNRRERRPRARMRVEPGLDVVADREPRMVVEQRREPGGQRRDGGDDPCAFDRVKAPAGQALDRGGQLPVQRKGEHELCAGRAFAHPRARDARPSAMLELRDQRVEVRVDGRSPSVELRPLRQSEHRRGRARVLPRHAWHHESVARRVQRAPVGGVALGARLVARLERAAAHDALARAAALLVLDSAATRTRLVATRSQHRHAKLPPAADGSPARRSLEVSAPIPTLRRVVDRRRRAACNLRVPWTTKPTRERSASCAT